MSTPANAATQGEQPGSAENKQATIGQDKVIPELSENDKFESAVNDAVKKNVEKNLNIDLKSSPIWHLPIWIYILVMIIITFLDWEV